MISKNINHNVALLKWYNFFYDFRPWGAIAVLYLAQVTGSFAQGLGIFAIASVAAAIFEIPTGVISDRVGRRKTVIFGSIASVIAMSFYALGGSFTILVTGAIFNGLTRAFISGNNDALLYDTMKQQGKTEEFSDKLGKTNSMFEIGLGVSALLASLLALVSLQFVVVASIIPQIICVFIALKFIEPKVHTDEVTENIYSHLREALGGFVKNVKLRKLSLASILDFALEEIHFELKPAFTATLWPAWALGISRSLDHVFGYAGCHYSGAITERFGAIKTLFGQQIISRLNIFVAAGFPTVFSPLLLNINSFFFGVGNTASSTLLHREFTDKQRATMGSLNSLGGSLVYAVLTVGVGLTADKFGPAKTVLILAAASLVVVAIYGNLFKKHRWLIGERCYRLKFFAIQSSKEASILYTIWVSAELGISISLTASSNSSSVTLNR